MFLSSLRLSDFCCYQDFSIDDLQSLAVVIGENDVGKTILLEAIHVLCEPGQYDAALCARKIGEEQYADEVTVEGIFEVEDKDNVNPDYVLNGRIRIRHTFNEQGATTEAHCESFADEEAKDFGSLLAQPQKNYLKSFGLEGSDALGNDSKRQASFAKLAEEGRLPVEECWTEISRRDAGDLLPTVQRISAQDFEDPDSLVRSALRRAARSAIQEEDPETGEKREIEALKPVRDQIGEAVREEIKKAKDILKTHHGSLVDIDIDPHLDFGGALSTSYLTVNMGHGQKRVRSFGQGTKRRLWMGLLEWDGEIAIDEDTPTIRLYDEPDVNLHYNAQRRLLENVSQLSRGDDSNVQCFLCTHSVTFINRVPPKNLTLLSTEGRERRAEQVRGQETDDFSSFYDSIGAAIGLTNVSLLFEHGFLLLEGPAEFRAVPILYQTLFGTSMQEDRIKPINLEGCGSWHAVLKMLLTHRRDIVHLLLDEDCKLEESSAKISANNFEDFGIDPAFLDTNVSFVGDKEYEDAFSNGVIAHALNAEYERKDKRDWHPSEVRELREADKFSERLKQEVWDQTLKQNRSKTRKPDLAESVARHCASEDVPDGVKEALLRIREKAGVR